MSTDRATASVGVRVRAALAHPLVGRDPRRTRIALVALGVVAAAEAASHLAAREVLGVRLQEASVAFDTLTMLVIVAGTAVSVVGPLAYAVWNDGPALAFVAAVAPVAVGEVAAGRYVMDVDLAVALAAGVAGAALALYLRHARETGRVAPWRVGRPDPLARTVVLVLSVATGVATVRFVLAAPGRVVAAYAPFATLWLVPIAVATGYALGWLRSATGVRRSRRGGASGDARTRR